MHTIYDTQRVSGEYWIGPRSPQVPDVNCQHKLWHGMMVMVTFMMLVLVVVLVVVVVVVVVVEARDEKG